jgi:hypothetical protein
MIMDIIITTAMIHITEVIGDIIRFITHHITIRRSTITAGIHHGIPVFISATDGEIATMDGTITDMDIIMVIIMDIIQIIIRFIIRDIHIPTEEGMVQIMNITTTDGGIIRVDFQEVTITGPL